MDIGDAAETGGALYESCSMAELTEASVRYPRKACYPNHPDDCRFRPHLGDSDDYIANYSPDRMRGAARYAAMRRHRESRVGPECEIAGR
jgi:hypothetical protein